MIGIPIYFDQGMNIEIATQKGFAINVPIETLTADKILMAVRKVLSEPRYVHRAVDIDNTKFLIKPREN